MKLYILFRNSHNVLQLCPLNEIKISTDIAPPKGHDYVPLGLVSRFYRNIINGAMQKGQKSAFLQNLFYKKCWKVGLCTSFCTASSTCNQPSQSWFFNILFRVPRNTCIYPRRITCSISSFLGQNEFKDVENAGIEHKKMQELSITRPKISI